MLSSLVCTNFLNPLIIVTATSLGCFKIVQKLYRVVFIDIVTATRFNFRTVQKCTHQFVFSDIVTATSSMCFRTVQKLCTVLFSDIVTATRSVQKLHTVVWSDAVTATSSVCFRTVQKLCTVLLRGMLTFTILPFYRAVRELHSSLQRHCDVH